jgi:flotillin
MKVQEYQASVNQRKAEADLAYDIQKFKTGQEVKKEEVQVEVVAKEKQIEVQEREIKRRELELDATIRKPAEAEQYRVKTIADAEKFKLETEANGRAAARKAEGFADADVQARTGEAEGQAIKARGVASADVIRAQGLAEAEANRKKAEAWQYYNEAAIAQLLIENLPALAREIAAPLSRTDKITIVSMGGNGGQGAGAAKVTQDIGQVIATLPPVIESLTGLKIEELLQKIPAMKGKWAESQAETAESGATVGRTPAQSKGPDEPPSGLSPRKS